MFPFSLVTVRRVLFSLAVILIFLHSKANSGLNFDTLKSLYMPLMI
nr:MAG TPA: hypothetical protein [Crassvirales sp.]